MGASERQVPPKGHWAHSVAVLEGWVSPLPACSLFSPGSLWGHCPSGGGHHCWQGEEASGDSWSLPQPELCSPPTPATGQQVELSVGGDAWQGQNLLQVTASRTQQGGTPQACTEVPAWRLTLGLRDRGTCTGPHLGAEGPQAVAVKQIFSASALMGTRECVSVVNGIICSEMH